MPSATDILGTVFKNGPATLLARLVDSSGSPLAPSEISALSYSVHRIDPRRPDSVAAVAGHGVTALTPAAVLFATLQTDPVWDVDAVGFNFRHELNVATFEAFPTAGAWYQVRYHATPVLGQKIVWRYLLRAI